MSRLIYIAADIPLGEMKQETGAPVSGTMTVREAQEAGVLIPDYLLQPDMNPEQFILQLEPDEEEGCGKENFYLRPIEKTADILTGKPYYAALEWHVCTDACAASLVHYINEMLELTPEVEIWNIWMGSVYPPPRVRTVTLDAAGLTPQVIMEIDSEVPGEQVCGGYRGYLPEEWNVSAEELEQDIWYCHVIRRGSGQM